MTDFTIVQQAVNKKHEQLCENDLILETFGGDPNSTEEDLCFWNVSTTKNSQIILFSVGAESMFTRNTYSSDKNNPWLVTSGEIKNSKLKNSISSDWHNMVLDPTMRDKICPFMVYEFVHNQLNREDLNVNNERIRVQIKDITIWCHLPRFEALLGVISETSGEEFRNEVEQFQNSVNELQNVDSNEEILEIERNERKEICKRNVVESFEGVYSYFENLDWEDDRKYTSYRYPTLQLGVNKAYQEGAQTVHNDRMRYGGTFSAVYKRTANKVHHKFAVKGTDPVPMPTKEKIWNWFVVRIPNIALEYNDVFNVDAPIHDPINVATRQEGQP